MRVSECSKQHYDRFMLIPIIRMATSADREHNTKRYEQLWRYSIVAILSGDRQRPTWAFTTCGQGAYALVRNSAGKIGNSRFAEGLAATQAN